MSCCYVYANINDEEVNPDYTKDLLLLLVNLVNVKGINRFILDENRKFEALCRNILSDKKLFWPRKVYMQAPIEISTYKFFEPDNFYYFEGRPSGKYFICDATTKEILLKKMIRVDHIIEFKESKICLIEGEAIY